MYKAYEVFLTVMIIIITVLVLFALFYLATTKQNFALYKSLCVIAEWFLSLWLYWIGMTWLE